MNLEEIKGKIKNAIDRLYKDHSFLIKEGLNERSISQKFATCLEQENFGNGYFVDCEYDKAYSSGENIGKKRVISERGNSIDIVITKRDNNEENDLACFETKKWSNKNKIEIERDRKKLRVLTGIELPTDFTSKEILKNQNGEMYSFNYKYGFFVVFGLTKEETKIEVYIRGQKNQTLLRYEQL